MKQLLVKLAALVLVLVSLNAHGAYRQAIRRVGTPTVRYGAEALTPRTTIQPTRFMRPFGGERMMSTSPATATDAAQRLSLMQRLKAPAGRVARYGVPVGLAAGYTQLPEQYRPQFIQTAFAESAQKDVQSQPRVHIQDAAEISEALKKQITPGSHLTDNLDRVMADLKERGIVNWATDQARYQLGRVPYGTGWVAKRIPYIGAKRAEKEMNKPTGPNDSPETIANRHLMRQLINAAEESERFAQSYEDNYIGTLNSKFLELPIPEEFQGSAEEHRLQEIGRAKGLIQAHRENAKALRTAADEVANNTVSKHTRDKIDTSQKTIQEKFAPKKVLRLDNKSSLLTHLLEVENMQAHADRSYDSVEEQQAQLALQEIRKQAASLPEKDQADLIDRIRRISNEFKRDHEDRSKRRTNLSQQVHALRDSLSEMEKTYESREAQQDALKRKRIEQAREAQNQQTLSETVKQYMEKARSNFAGLFPSASVQRSERQPTEERASFFDTFRAGKAEEK